MTSNSPNTYYIKELNPDIIAPSTYSLTQPEVKQLVVRNNDSCNIIF